MADLKEYLVWMLALAIVVIGGRYAKRFIVFVLDELYQLFIQNNPNTT